MHELPPDAPNPLNQPADAERAEIEAFLQADQTRLGDVYRLRDLEPDAIAAQLGVSTPNFVWNYTRTIRALLDRDLPTAPSVALQTARRFRRILKAEWSSAARQRLTADLEELEKRAADIEAVIEETVTASEQTALAEKTAVAGIYVYSLSHYLRYPFDATSGRTLLKVGRSDSDVMQRIRHQTRTTALPEEPVLLRIYPTGEGETAPIERQFHDLLRAFDHDRTVERVAGLEWFLTTTRALDAVAKSIGLERVEVNNVGDFLSDP